MNRVREPGAHGPGAAHNPTTPLQTHYWLARRSDVTQSARTDTSKINTIANYARVCYCTPCRAYTIIITLPPSRLPKY